MSFLSTSFAVYIHLHDFAFFMEQIIKKKFLADQAGTNSLFGFVFCI